MVNISFIRLKGKVTDNYKLTKSGWLNKMVNWDDLHKVMGSSKIQFSCYSWRNGYKTYDNFQRDKQDCLIWDIDNGLTIPQFQKMFSKYQYILATTKSHMKEKKGTVCDRFRVLIKAINIPSDDLVYFRAMELLAPFNDAQTLTPTGSFLGTDNCLIVKNEGKSLDMYKASMLAEGQLDSEKVEKLSFDKDLMPSYSNNSFQEIKENLAFEDVVSVLDSLGYEITKNKFRLREEEQTASATINYKTLYIRDYGDDEAGGDIFDILVKHQGMSFSEAKRYVSNFI